MQQSLEAGEQNMPDILHNYDTQIGTTNICGRPDGQTRNDMQEMTRMWVTRLLQCTDGIPVRREFLLLLNLVRTKRSCEITIMYQPMGTPQPNADRRTRGLNCKAAADMRENETTSTEDTFDVNSCGYMTKGSAHQINTRKLRTYQELRGNHEPCVTSVDKLCVARATT